MGLGGVVPLTGRVSGQSPKTSNYLNVFKLLKYLILGCSVPGEKPKLEKLQLQKIR